MQHEIKPGVTVQLRSGGPAMTVDSMDGTHAVCTWFDARGEHQTRTFALVTLVIIPTPRS